MAHWYVYRENEAPLGPWTTEAIAEAILAGTLSPETWIAAPAGAKWLRASAVPVIARLLDGQPTRRGVESAAIARAPDTHRTPPPAAPPPGAAVIEVAPAAPPRPYYMGGDTLESPNDERQSSQEKKSR